MKTATLIATLVLGCLALLIWALTSFGYFNPYSPSESQIAMPTVFSIAAMLGWVLLVVLHKRRESETRCRRCGYILRGLSEPRCPECGERI